MDTNTDLSAINPYDIKKYGADKTQDITDLVTDSYFAECSKRYSYLSDDDENDELKVTFTPMHGIGGYWMTMF